MANLPKDACKHPITPEKATDDVAVRLFAALDSEIGNTRATTAKHIRLAYQDDYNRDSQR